jgi:hypothetical protein
MVIIGDMNTASAIDQRTDEQLLAGSRVEPRLFEEIVRRY